ncbi:hypothetical protein KIPE111705_37845 [Kibdelosporangium persicum]|uniref:Uncharacterized protein n=1 Tax=Kibdelosporangium persicum TaxID=2698649 RepID=A0ABX2EVY4_9PSEU|nr:hypothetical protein [Kibdelosporangium persicum]NRN63139.1 hypothetical protein [Kibdelosporangium persicum]
MSEPSAAEDLRRGTVKRVHGFDDWPGRDGPPLAAEFLPDHSELRPLTFIRRDALPDAGRAFIDHLSGPPGTSVAVRLRQYPTAADAHEALVDVLTMVMAPRLPHCAERGAEPVGDVCFCGLAEPIETTFFVRANVLVRIHNTGERPVAVTALAAALDRQIQRVPRSATS